MIPANTLLLRLVRRQLRLPIVYVYMLAVMMACTVTVSVLLLGNRFEQHFLNQAKTLLAADLVLESTSPLSNVKENLIQSSSLRNAQTLTFVTMASSSGQFLLSSIKAVSSQYPLVGELRVAFDRFTDSVASRQGPPIGEVWVEDRVLDQLGVKIGDLITIGDHSFPITRLLVFEPDRGAQFYSFTPRILMHQDDVAKTGVIQPGSRVTYRYLLAGENDSIQAIEKQFSLSLLPNQKILTVESSSEMLSGSLQRAMQFLTMAALVAIALGAMAIALAAYRVSQGMAYSYALMRSLGMNRRQLLLATWIPFCCFTVIALLVGLLFGNLLHLLIVQQFSPLLQVDLPTPGLAPYIISAIAGLAASLVFSWPFISQLQNVSELALLRQQSIQPAAFKWMLSMLVGLFGLLFWLSGDGLLSAVMTLAMVVFLVVLYVVVSLLVRLLYDDRWHRSLVSKLSARLLRANHKWVTLQISVLALAVLGIALVITMAEDLMQSWQSKVPDDAPNYFAMNLYLPELPKFKAKLNELGVDETPLYPIVRGRLSAVNGEPIRKYATKETGRSDESLRRDLALTYTMHLPTDNKIISGYWHSKEKGASVNTVSVEQGVAENLDIMPGDMLEFTIGTQKVNARVTSIRSVEWESFRPNFYMIFYPGVLDDLPRTYLTSFHLEEEQRRHFSELVKAFPTATFFDVAYLINRIEGIAKQVASAVTVLLSVSLFAAMVIFIIIELIQYQSRLQSGAILKSLGAGNSLLLKIYGRQFLWIGYLSGLLALTLTILASGLLGHYMFEGDLVFNIKTIGICLLVTPVIVLLTGLITVLKTRNTVPAMLLKSLHSV